MTVSGDTTIPVQKAGVFEDLIDVFVRPAKLFDRERNGSFVKPALIQMIVMLVLAVALHNLIAPFVDADMQLQTSKQAAAMAAQGKSMPEGAAAMQEKFASVGYYAVPIVAPWLIGLLGGALLFVSARIVGAKPTYGQSAMISSWAYMPGILATLVVAIFGALMDTTSIRSMADGQIGLGRLVDPTTASTALQAVLRNVELFTLWGVAITGVGVAVITRGKFGTGLTAAIIKWAIVVLISVVPALLAG